MSRDVVVAEHDPFLRRLVGAAIEPAHRVVATAETGVEAVELATEHRPDVALVALSLPIQNGVDATAAIVESTAGTGVVACTGREDTEGIRAAREAGASEVVVRPFQRSGLLEAIDAAAPG